MAGPDFSPFASEYARARPTYPPELFAHLASLVESHRLAWDCATGNGQAALDLVRDFERVVATDVSAEQIRHAPPHPRVEYRVAPAEASGLDDGSVDLVTVAAAVHWFDPARFGAEVRRVVRAGGVLAVWTYHVGQVEPPFDRVFAGFYRDVLAPYFRTGARLVDEAYQGLQLPGQPIAAPPFTMSAEWNLDRMLAFIRSWSGTQKYLQEKGKDPTDLIVPELERLWGQRDAVHTVRWPLIVRMTRI